MPVVNVLEESKLQGAFYVPEFEVKIEGVGLPRDILRDITDLTYKDNIKEIDSFELTVNNWDASLRDFKYVGAETPATLKKNSKEGQLHRLFEPCNKQVEVRMGYAGSLQLMIRATFTTMEPKFTSQAAPTLTVRGLNVLHQLRRKQFTTAWQNKTDSQVAENIATLRDQGKKRFPLPILVDDKSKGLEKPIPYIAQNNQYDIDFLLSRARQRGYVVFVKEGDPKARGPKKERHLFFGPSDSNNPALRDVTFELEWGKSLIDFKPTLTTANQIKSVTVQGWNRSAKKAIKETVTLDDKRLNVNKDLREMLMVCDPREEVVVDEPVFTACQARERAISILMDRNKEVIKCSGTTIGLPDLRAGTRINIVGIGSRFSGTYFITSTTHVVNDGGYTTKFDGRREDKGLQVSL